MSQTETTTHKARKRHRCTWCWQFIEIGETYLRYRYYGDDACTVKEHPECYEAMLEAVREEGGFFEWTPGQERPTAIDAARRGYV